MPELTREEAAFKRVFGRKRRKSSTPAPAVTQPAWPSREMRVTGPGIDVLCRWEQKYGVWFCVHAEREIMWMAVPYCYTVGRLPSLARQGLSYRWL